MTCAACQARVEKALASVPGVESCAVSLLTNSAGVEGTASDAEIIEAIKKAGYGASLPGAGSSGTGNSAASLDDTGTPALRRRLCTSLIFLAALMYLTMGHVMFSLPVPAGLSSNPMAVALTELLLTVIVIAVNRAFFVSGVRAILNGSPNMDSLVSLGSAAAFVYSLALMYKMTALNTVQEQSQLLKGLFFESSAMILTLITVGKLLEAKSKGRTTDALRALMNLAPQTANVIRDGAEMAVPVSEVIPGDVFAVRPGDSIPVDGTVARGESAVNESALTGESLPVDKAPGSSVYAGTVNTSGYLECTALKVGEDTALSGIIRLVSDAAATKAPVARLADKVSAVFVPVVMGIALITLGVWMLLGRPFGFAVARAISVLVISCPCALGLATPVAIMVGSGVGARHGILFKTASALEGAGNVSSVLLDKTGTVTNGTPAVTDVVPCRMSADELLAAAASIESCSGHPLAVAVAAEAEYRGLALTRPDSFTAVAGRGIKGTVNGTEYSGGSPEYVGQMVYITQEMLDLSEKLAGEGKTPLLFAGDGELLGLIAVSDTLRESAADSISRLKNMGIRVTLLTGDNERTANAFAAQTGPDEVISGVLPAGKEQAVRRAKKNGKVMMVGDGINDAPALASADTGVAIGAGTDVAIDAADVVLMRSRIEDIPALVCLSRAVLRNIRQNLFWAFFYNAVCIPLAAGVLVPLGITLNPMIAAAAMSLSSFTVVSNALRLNRVDIYDPSNDRLLKQRSVKKEKNMTRTMKIEGMMCPHCEARVKKTLESLDGVVSAEVSHTAGTAVVECSGISDEALKAAVEAQDYRVLSIE